MASRIGKWVAMLVVAYTVVADKSSGVPGYYSVVKGDEVMFELLSKDAAEDLAFILNEGHDMREARPTYYYDPRRSDPHNPKSSCTGDSACGDPFAGKKPQ